MRIHNNQIPPVKNTIMKSNNTPKQPDFFCLLMMEFLSMMSFEKEKRMFFFIFLFSFMIVIIYFMPSSSLNVFIDSKDIDLFLSNTMIGDLEIPPLTSASSITIEYPASSKRLK